jgi:DNA ligase-1
MLLAELVNAAERVAATASRNVKVATLAELIGLLSADEVAPAIGFLSGDVRQGKVGIGWARLSGVRANHARDPSLTVADLDELLTKILETTGSRSVKARDEILGEFLARATSQEADFLRRLLVGELRQGALVALVADAIAVAAGVSKARVRRAHMLAGDLGKVASVAMTTGDAGLATIGLEVLNPVLPMLASTADDVETALAVLGPASVEWKLDGVRIQVHRWDKEVRVFTRNLNDITERVPAIVAMALSLPVTTGVFDGEAIVFDDEQRPLGFKDTMSRVGRHVADEVVPTGAYFFDCLHLDGRDLIDLPLAERLEALEGVAGRYRIPSLVTENPKEAQKLMKEALTAGHEGVIVKALDSTYQAGRRGKAWRKVKPEKTLDLVILAAEWGHGRRRGWLSNLHLGARDPAGGFVMVGKTFKGLTDQMLQWQTDHFLGLKTEEKGITVYVRPELVVEIELDGVQESTRYPGGVALRFARVKRYRTDKDPIEADTIETVRSLL